MRRMALCLAMIAIAAVTLTWSNPIFASAVPASSLQYSNNLVATNTFTSVADSYVDSSNPTVNYGTSTQLRIDASPTVRSYVRFSVQGLSSAVTKATLRIYANTGITSGYTANRVSDNTWTETGLTYNNAPAVGAAINTSAVVSAATWTTIDVTSYVTGNGTFSFALTSTNATALSLGSREATNKPQLVVETNSPTPTATVGATSVPPTATSVAPTATAVPPTATTAPSGGTLTFTSLADSYVDSSNPTVNYGTSTQLRIDASPTVRSYVRFSVQGLSGAVTKATLRIYANTGITSGYTANRVSDNTWTETGLTYNNAPAVGAAINTSAVVSAATWTTIDVTSYVTGNGTFSFALTSTNATALSLASREATNKPQLVVTTGTGTLPTATPTSVVVNTPTSTPVAVNTPTPVPPTATSVAPTATSTPSSGTDPVILLTGDSRTGCDAGGTAVANLLDTLPTSWPLLFNGDATSTGAYSEFTDCYNTTYGRHKAQIKPVPGNHEYLTAGGSGYFQYYGSQAGVAGKGYYSFHVGTWHIVALNTEIDHAAGSAQETWLKADLAANPAPCTLAYWHEPRWSSGVHGNSVDMDPLWKDLYAANAEIVMNGHDHDYERFAPQNPSGALDNAKGIREWVLGTGGVALRTWGTTKANSEVRNDTTWGVLKLTLHPSSYDWQFLPVAGQSFTDSGTTACH